MVLGVSRVEIQVFFYLWDLFLDRENTISIIYEHIWTKRKQIAPIHSKSAMTSLVFRLVDCGTCHPTPMSDQDRISPKKPIQHQADKRWELRKKSIRGLSVDPIPNSPK